MISLELFKDVIANIQEQEIIDLKVSKSLELISDSWVMINTKNKEYESLRDILKEIFNDVSDMIGWWLYEDVMKVVYINKKEVSVRSVEELYTVLTK